MILGMIIEVVVIHFSPNGAVDFLDCFFRRRLKKIRKGVNRGGV